MDLDLLHIVSRADARRQVHEDLNGGPGSTDE
jgi:hypothetical protein